MKVLWKLNVLFTLKRYKGEFWKFDYSKMWNIFCFNLEVHAFRYLRGYENEGLGGVCESEIGNPLTNVEMSLAPNYPHIICQLPYTRNRSLD